MAHDRTLQAAWYLGKLVRSGAKSPRSAPRQPSMKVAMRKTLLLLILLALPLTTCSDTDSAVADLEQRILELEGRLPESRQPTSVPPISQPTSVSERATPVPPAPVPAASGITAGGFSVLELVDAQPELSILRSLLNESGLADTLDSGGPFTLFAPTNDAFRTITAELLQLRSDPEMLQEFLLHHLLDGEVLISEMQALEKGRLTAGTLIPGVPLQLTIDDGNAVLVNDVSQVLVEDAKGRNGVMHIINHVLFPSPNAAANATQPPVVPTPTLGPTVSEEPTSERIVESNEPAGLTQPQQNAARSALTYLDFSGFSRQGLIDQLSSEFGDQYDVQDATTAVDSLDVNWTSQAVRSAQTYLDVSGFSRQGLIDQLSSEFGDQHAIQDATTAVDSLDVNWTSQAVRSAQTYLELSGFSCNGLIEQLSSSFGDQYTVEEATNGASQAGAC